MNNVMLLSIAKRSCLCLFFFFCPFCPVTRCALHFVFASLNDSRQRTARAFPSGVVSICKTISLSHTHTHKTSLLGKLVLATSASHKKKCPCLPSEFQKHTVVFDELPRRDAKSGSLKSLGVHNCLSGLRWPPLGAWSPIAEQLASLC